MNRFLKQCLIHHNAVPKITVIGIGDKAGSAVWSLDSNWWFDAECFSIYNPKTYKEVDHLPISWSSCKNFIQTIQRSDWVIIASALEDDAEKSYFDEIASFCKKHRIFTTGIITDTRKSPDSANYSAAPNISTLVSSLLVISPESFGKIQLHSYDQDKCKPSLAQSINYIIKMLVYSITREKVNSSRSPDDIYEILRSGKIGYIGVGASSDKNIHSAQKVAVKQAFRRLKKQGVTGNNISSVLACYESKNILPDFKELNPMINLLSQALEHGQKYVWALACPATDKKNLLVTIFAMVNDIRVALGETNEKETPKDTGR
jgi:hypothetical protein